MIFELVKELDEIDAGLARLFKVITFLILNRNRFILNIDDFANRVMDQWKGKGWLGLYRLRERRQ